MPAVNTPATSQIESDVLTACRSLARRLGLGTLVTPGVIGRFSNLALRLDPTPWVARVATGTAGPRAGLDGARREVALGRALAEAALAGWREAGPALDEALLAQCVALRALFIVAWSAWLGADTPRSRSRLAARLGWLRLRAGG